MNETRIDITTLDGLTDLIVTQSRPKQDGYHNIELITDSFYRTIDVNEYRQQPVQSINYAKYTIELMAIEDYPIELLKTAKKILVSRYNASLIHEAVILNITREKAGSDISHIIIEYYDIRNENYPYALPPVTNHLRSDAIKERTALLQTNTLRVFDHINTYDFATTLEINQTAAQPENQSFTNTQDGLTVNTNTIIKNNYQLVFYLSGEDIIPFQSVVPLADGYSVRAWYFAGPYSWNVIEAPTEVAVERVNGFDIWKASCSIVFNAINHFSYKN